MNQLVVVESESESLPALLDRAAQRLIGARTSAEVLEAKKIAELALHLAKVTDAANETHADCLRIIFLAQNRIVDAVDADPNVAPRGWKSDVQRSDITTLDEIGIDRRRLAEWRELRDAGEEVEQALQFILGEGRAPTKAEVRNTIRGTLGGTAGYEWYTPAKHIELVRSVLGVIDLDPASNAIAQETVRATTFYSEEDCGLSKPWKGKVYLNPPYRQPLMGGFVSKLLAEIAGGNVTEAILLGNNYTETEWFHQVAAKATATCLVRGRIKFDAGPGSPPSTPTRGQVFFYFGENVARFAEVFGEIGEIYPASITPRRSND
jgi:hypothetical protein